MNDLVRGVFVLTMVGVVLLMISAVIRVLRSDHPRRGWFALLALVGVFRVTLVWNTAEVLSSLLPVSLLGIAMRSYEPLGTMLSVSFPAGALTVHEIVNGYASSRHDAHDEDAEVSPV